MSFVRAFIGKTSGQVQHIIESDVPFIEAPTVDVRNAKGEPAGEELEPADFGWLEPPPEGERTTTEGRPCSTARYVFDRVKNRPAPTSAQLHSGGGELPRFHDCPCTLEGIKDRLRARGPAGIPMKARAWLVNVLPPEEAAAMGIARGISIATLKAAEAIRNRRDPSAGSRMFLFERVAQARSDKLAVARLRARKISAERERKRVAEKAAKAVLRAKEALERELVEAYDQEGIVRELRED